MNWVGVVFCRVMIEGSGKTWKQDQRVRIQHVDTGVYLHSHDKKYTRIAGGQQEVRIMKLNSISPPVNENEISKFVGHLRFFRGFCWCVESGLLIMVLITDYALYS